LPLYWQEAVTPEFTDRLTRMVQRRCVNEPLQYILQTWSFLDMTLATRPGALIPRPETEEVFAAAVQAIEHSDLSQNFCFADIGTGTGALGLALARHFKIARGLLIDISPAALAVACENLLAYAELKDRVWLMQSDLLSALQPASLQVIISSPPYINSGDIATLMPEVRDHEPHLALDGGIDGLLVIERLLMQAAEKLVPGGLLILEHGHGQRQGIINIIDESWGSYCAGDDLCGCERYFILTRSEA